MLASNMEAIANHDVHNKYPDFLSYNNHTYVYPDITHNVIATSMI